MTDWAGSRIRDRSFVEHSLQQLAKSNVYFDVLVSTSFIAVLPLNLIRSASRARAWSLFLL